MNNSDKQVYEAVMKQCSKTVVNALNEMSTNLLISAAREAIKRGEPERAEKFLAHVQNHGTDELFPLNKTIIKSSSIKNNTASYLIYDEILDEYKAEEMADDFNTTTEEAAETWFNEVAIEDNFTEETQLPKYHKFIKTIQVGNLYYDYSAEYFFLVKENTELL